jgi:hypothetical protein
VTRGDLAGGNDHGRGVHRRSGSLTIIGYLISGHTAYLGGGVANSVSGTVTIAKSTASGNTAIASQDSGGGFNNGNGSNSEVIAILTKSVISGSGEGRR